MKYDYGIIFDEKFKKNKKRYNRIRLLKQAKDRNPSDEE